MQRPSSIHPAVWILEHHTVTGAGCVLPPQAPDPSGYVIVGMGEHSTHRFLRAHRLMYEYLVAPIPPGMVIDHVCRNRACCNVGHLRVVDARTNVTENIIGVGWQLEAAKSSCPREHPYSGDNLYLTPRGHRQCRTCRKDAAARHRLKRTPC